MPLRCARIDVEIGVVLQKEVKRCPRFESCESGPHAEVDPAAEAQVRTGVPPRVKLVGPAEVLFVAVRAVPE